jgi:2-iminobutanoate/2-iminopropanoate deaminase
LDKNSVFLEELNSKIMSKYRTILLLFMLLFLHGCKQDQSYPVFHPSHEANRSNVPFSDVVETENLLFLAGQIGKDHKSGLLVEGGITAETRQVIRNIEEVLNFHQLSLDNVVKCTVILKDINDFSAFNKVYTQYFTKKPARTTFAAAGLAAGASIEIEVIAAK